MSVTPEQKTPRPAPEIPLSKQMANRQSADLIRAAKEAKARGEKIAWSSAVFPQEIPEALDMVVLYPESFSAGVAARKKAGPFLEEAEGALGYSPDICSYIRINFAFGALHDKEGFEEFEFPMPDCLLLCNNSCGQVMKWFENLAEQLDIPIFFFDAVYNYDEEGIPDYRMQYLTDQLSQLIADLEAFTGRKLDQERFLEVQKRSQLNRELFQQVVEKSLYKPSPATGFDLYNYISVMITCRGKSSTTEIMTQLRDEMEARHQSGASSFRGEERHRTYWSGIACWPYLSHNMRTMKRSGMNIVASGYVRSWMLEYEPGDLTSMARAYAVSVAANISVPEYARRSADMIRDYGCDNMICHNNRSCKISAYNLDCGRHLILQETGVPCISFDGDQSDYRVYSEAQFETRILGLEEILEGKEGTGHAK